ncbi:hypothetical protein SUDANB6_05866 [Streptomyces sp. enrichment culture]|uniref:transmembrane-type terpene cyclase n=1 Tax=Streptomyces sp. enrichment culture TaxID=1795815 RepID=UPI003F565549
MVMTLMGVSAAWWTVTYVLIIRAGLRDRTYGMPLVALCGNLAWEGIYVFTYPHTGAARLSNIVWLLLDCVILYTAVRFGAREFPWLPRWGFLLGLAATGVMCWLGMDALIRQFGGVESGGTYAGFVQNLVMSCLFLNMLMRRGTTAGQSMAIAAGKLLGTAFASVAAYLWLSDGTVTPGPLLPYLFVAILVLDLTYLAALYAVGRAARLSRTAVRTGRQRDGAGAPVPGGAYRPRSRRAADGQPAGH